MSDLKHDPELPFVAVGASTREVFARFSNLEGAVSFSDDGPYVVEVIDTTPKPKIPEDAEFIHYIKSGYDFYVRQLEDGTWKSDGGSPYSYSEILELVEDVAEVTVLVRKEES